MVVGESSELAASEPWGGSLCCLRSREGLGMARAEPHNGKDRLQGHRLGAAEVRPGLLGLHAPPYSSAPT